MFTFVPNIITEHTILKPNGNNMNKKHLFILTLLACGCSKDTAITESPLPVASTDTAKLILVTATSASMGTSLVAYNPEKVKQWEQNGLSPAGFWSIPAYGDNKIFVTSDRQLLSLNAGNGTNNWTYTNTIPLTNPKFRNDTIVTAATIIAPSPQNALLLLNKLNGNVIWSKPVSDQPIVAPLLDGDRIFALTTNGTGTIFTLSAYDLASKNLVWQKVLANAFLTAVPSDMILRKDTLIIGVPAGSINVVNKNTGNVYWSKSLNTNHAYLYNDKLVYNDVTFGRLNILSIQTGNTLFQSPPSNAIMASAGNKLSYLYNNALYYQALDTLYCTNLTDGTLRWKKPCSSYFQKVTVVGKTAYGIKALYNSADEMRLMIMNAEDFTAKDSVTIPRRTYKNLTVLSAAGLMY